VTGTAESGVVEHADADILQRLHDLVGRVDILFGRIALLSGVRCSPARTDPHWASEEREPRLEGLAPGGGGEGEDQGMVRVQGAMVKVAEVATPRTLLEASRATILTEQEGERRAGTVQEKGEAAEAPADSQDRPPSTE
jgi:hypothetical protein